MCALEGGAFPLPETILRYSERMLARKVPLGYRARTIRTIAKLTAEDKLPLDDWAAQGDFTSIEQTVKAVWGIGPYSLRHIMVLLGKFDYIPVDSEILRYLRNTHFKGREVSESEAVRPYDRYGHMKYLAFKFGRMARRQNYIN